MSLYGGKHIFPSFHPLGSDPDILVVIRDYLISDDSLLYQRVR